MNKTDEQIIIEFEDCLQKQRQEYEAEGHRLYEDLYENVSERQGFLVNYYAYVCYRLSQLNEIVDFYNQFIDDVEDVLNEYAVGRKERISLEFYELDLKYKAEIARLKGTAQICEGRSHYLEMNQAYRELGTNLEILRIIDELHQTFDDISKEPYNKADKEASEEKEETVLAKLILIINNTKQAFEQQAKKMLTTNTNPEAVAFKNGVITTYDLVLKNIKELMEHENDE